jgi:hypothetical protein
MTSFQIEGFITVELCFVTKVLGFIYAKISEATEIDEIRKIQTSIHSS